MRGRLKETNLLGVFVEAYHRANGCFEYSRSGQKVRSDAQFSVHTLNNNFLAAYAETLNTMCVARAPKTG